LNVVDHHNIQEHNIAERYLFGKLTVSERAEFEEHFVDCTECIHLLEMTEGFRMGLRKVAAEQSTGYALVGFLGWLARLSTIRRAALLMTVLLVLILPLTLVVIQLQRARGDLTRMQAISAESQRTDAENQQTVESLKNRLRKTLQRESEQQGQPGGLQQRDM